MATKALFIDPAEIIATGYIDENTDNKVIRNTIDLCMEKYIHPIIGTGIYDQLKTQINANTVGTGTVSNDTMLKTYIQPALKWRVHQEGIDAFVYHFRNKGVMKNNTDNSQPIDTTEIVRLMEKFRNNAEMYENRLVKWLQENHTTFTLYDNPGSTIDTIHPRKYTYTTNWFMGSNKRCDEYMRAEYPHLCDECGD